MTEENLRLRDHAKEELSFYSKATTDIRVPVPVRLGRALGHCRPHGLRPQRSIRSTPARAMEYFDQEANETLHSLCGGAVPRRRPCDFGLPAATHTTKRWSMQKRRTPAWSCTCIRRLRRSRPRCLPLSKKLNDKAQEVYNAPDQALYGGLRRRRFHWQAVSPAG